MLIEVKNYLSRQRLASLYELTVHFQVEADVMRGWLTHWMRKGKVCQRLPCGGCGSGCGGCHAAERTEFYEWVGSAP